MVLNLSCLDMHVYNALSFACAVSGLWIDVCSGLSEWLGLC